MFPDKPRPEASQSGLPGSSTPESVTGWLAKLVNRRPTGAHVRPQWNAGLTDSLGTGDS